MKHLYTAALAAAVALTASAASVEKQAPATSLNAKLQAVELTSEVKAAAASTRKAPAKAAAKADALGTYTWTLTPKINGLDAEYIVTITEDGTADGLLIKGLFGYNLKATFTNGTIQVACQQLTFNSTYGEWETFVTATVDSSNKAVPTEADPLTLTFNNGAWSSDQLYGVVGRTEAGVFTNDEGWYALGQGATLASEADITVYDDAEWTCNFLAGLFNGTSVVTEPTITTVKHNAATNEYTIADPIGVTYAQMGFSSVSPSAIVDATDPTNCVVMDFSTKINGGTTDGIYYLLSYSANTSDISTVPEDYRIYVTEDDNTITITFPVKSMLFWPSNTSDLYWANSKAESKLVLKKATSGIADAIVDADAPVTYFNLQGQRVANPTSGIFVKVQGGKATKVAL